MLALAVGLPLAAFTGEADVSGRWEGPIGRMVVEVSGDKVEGRLEGPSEVCPLGAGELVLRGVLTSGSFAGELRFCLEGCAAAGEDLWAFTLLVVEQGRMAGAAHVAAGSCEVPGRGKRGAVVLERVAEAVEAPERVLPVGPTMPEGTYDPRRGVDPRQRALSEARTGAALLERGRFEAARKHFLAAVEIDPTYAEGFNGIGVTYALRRDFDEAISWYRRSVSVAPFIGDAYYNLACAYAQTGEPELAVRYLRLAVLNGYAEISHLAADPDLALLRGRDDYQEVLALGELSSTEADEESDRAAPEPAREDGGPRTTTEGADRN